MRDALFSLGALLLLVRDILHSRAGRKSDEDPLKLINRRKSLKNEWKAEYSAAGFCSRVPRRGPWPLALEGIGRVWESGLMRERLERGAPDAYVDARLVVRAWYRSHSEIPVRAGDDP
jgi:hypothetical protein